LPLYSLIPDINIWNGRHVFDNLVLSHFYTK
jgi:hypothetical protein